ncbi:hypothetical protein J22TS1_48020 [Siminovitchia terrae]|uniref:DUF4352 domain-containing protein n=1 Tax=Siminovitchia terrae TaxID=1914933 RepID=UPI001B076EDC|nr:DUF4352 domain-containing protein [Siminovitchia terrae]GIN93751.1 hypothetical protein J22TS1_48020 [Siminovitchia terrae]
MKRLLYVLATALLSFGLLTACSSDKSSNNGTNDSSKSNQEENEKANRTDKAKGDTSSGDFDDQPDLKLGDTAQIEDTLGKYEVTMESIKQVPDINGEGPQLEKLFIADITVKNIGDTTIEAKDVMDNFMFADEKETSGFPDEAKFFGMEEIKGELQPGKTITGKAVFDSYGNDTYYIFIDVGLVASKAVKNQVIWTISEDEITS